MNQYLADLHIHSVLSPCGDLEMSPEAIVKQAGRKGIDIITISDHNSTGQVALTEEIGRENGVFVLPGVEVNTLEEVHCLAFFENTDILREFQAYLDAHLPAINNDPVKFGYQVVLDREERIVYEEKRLLFSALNQSIEKVEKNVHALGGIFIPAHIDRMKNSILGQLGFIPQDLDVDAIEISHRNDVRKYANLHPELTDYTVITSSDAHCLEDIGKATTIFRMRNRSFSEIKSALRGLKGREVRVV